MIQCSDESRKQWRLKYITALRNKLESTETDGSLTMHLCLILTQWMDTGTVVAEKFLKDFTVQYILNTLSDGTTSFVGSFHKNG